MREGLGGCGGKLDWPMIGGMECDGSDGISQDDD